MLNPRNEFELGQLVKYYDDFDDTWQHGCIEEIIPHAKSTQENYMCWYKVGFENGAMGNFSNCNAFLMCDTVEETYFLKHVEPFINHDDIYWS